MPSLRQLARSVRHAPGLERLDFVWDAVRKPYYALAAARGGVTLTLGGYPVRVPVEFADQGWESYEVPAMRTFTEWVSAHPTGVVLDVGCAVGLYTHVALSVSPSARVIAIDADIASIAAMLRLTASIPPGRLTPLSCLVGDVHGGGSLVDCYGETMRRLEHGEGARAPQYTCLGTTEAVPVYALDTFLPIERTRPLLLKMDIEGAELLALRGAPQLLARDDVTLLLSVHPVHLARDFGTSAGAVHSFLTRHGYRAELLATDHEEHWLYRR